jgi:phage terminase large subunit
MCQECVDRSIVLTRKNGTEYSWYTPQPHQILYHESKAPNLLALGTRNTGKSVQMRKDAIIRCMMYPGYKVLILRRTIPDLRKSHLRFINAEMKQLGDGVGYYRETTFDVKFTNDSFIQFSHCEQLKDVENYLGSEWDLIIFDELSTFTLEMFLTISAAARSTIDKPYTALVRAGSNTLGVGAAWMKQWFIDKNVNYEEYPDYNPDDFEMQFSTLDQNRYVSYEAYVKRLKNLPDHIRRAWLLGEFIIEGAYFTDFRPNKDNDCWHVIDREPKWRDAVGKYHDLHDLSWLNVYRAVDWGYWPDPAVCLWIAVLPSKQAIVFKELHRTRTLAKDFAQLIKKESEGMHVVDTFCDPTMEIKTGVDYSIGEIFEQNGIPITTSINDRVKFGYAIHDYLNTLIDGKPQLQIVKTCAELIRTIPKKIASGEDHWAVALAYFCMSQISPSNDPVTPSVHKWMTPKQQSRSLGYV